MRSRGKRRAMLVVDRDGLLDALDARVAAQRQAYPGRRITRSSLVREILGAWLHLLR